MPLWKFPVPYQSTDFNATAAWVLEKNVLRLQIAVNDTQSKQCTETLQDRVRHLADERRTQAAKMSTLQQIIEVDTEQLKSDADVCSEDKLLQHVDHIQFVIAILSTHSTTKTVTTAR